MFQQEMESRPRPGNKIVIRRRRKGRHNDSSSGTVTGSSDKSTDHLAVHKVTRSERNPLEKYKILIAH